jgi:hypothetical protein
LFDHYLVTGTEEQKMKMIAVRPTLLPGAVEQPAGPNTLITAILPGRNLQDIPELQMDTLIASDHCPLRPTRRLVVLVPEGGLDETDLARRVWLLASHASLRVLFLGRSPDQESDSDVRRRLALLAAAVHQGEVNAQASVVIGKSWLRAVEGVLTGGDLLVCAAGHKISHRIIARTGLGDALAETFQVPVYLLGGLPVGHSPAFGKQLRSLVAWAVSIAFLIAFSGLQIWLSQNASGRLITVLLGLSVIFEGIALLKIIEWIG